MTDEWKARLDMIRAYFQGEINTDQYQPFDDDFINTYLREKDRIPVRVLKKGGLTATAIVINSFISCSIGLLFALYIGTTNIWATIFFVFIAGVVASVMQVAYFLQKRGKKNANMGNKMVLEGKDS